MTLVEGLEQMGLRLDGMPDLQRPTAAIISNENVTKLIFCVSVFNQLVTKPDHYFSGN